MPLNVEPTKLDTVQSSLNKLQDGMHVLKADLDELQAKLGFVSRSKVNSEKTYPMTSEAVTYSDCVLDIQGKITFFKELDQQVRQLIIYLDLE